VRIKKRFDSRQQKVKVWPLKRSYIARQLISENWSPRTQSGIRYTSRNTSLEVLREEKRGLEQRVAVMDEMRGEIIKLDAEVEAGRQERETWRVKRFLQEVRPFELGFQGEQVH
jgi:hypothetical protein